MLLPNAFSIVAMVVDSNFPAAWDKLTSSHVCRVVPAPGAQA